MKPAASAADMFPPDLGATITEVPPNFGSATVS